MSYQALYRKYRPSSFDNVCGQEITVKILKNSIAYNKISHVYLFYGPRGTGKTSIAKIFARAVNCLDPKDGIQCGKCENCLLSSNSECVDIIEIDAASNNGVDEIRELKSKITFVPSSLKYKVYIIDEVHMLSTGAFNALLKTLEEPPEYVIFILATTEFSKVPTTIVSRCQTLEFKKITDNSIVERLKYIASEENINIDENALLEIAKNSNGGLRDSIGLLEKANSYSDKIDLETIRLITGNVSVEEREQFITLLNNRDINNIIYKINEYSDTGIDLSKFIKDLIEYYANNYINTKNTNTNICSIIKKLDNIYSDMIKSDNPKLVLEVSLLNMFTVDTSSNQDDVIIYNKVIKEEKPDKTESLPKNNNDELIKRRVYNTLALPDKNIIKEIRENWKNINDLAFDEKYGNLSRLLFSDIEARAASTEYIVLASIMDVIIEQINNDLLSVEKIIEKIFNNKYKIVCITEKEWKEYTDLYRKDKKLFVYEKEDNLEKKENKKNLQAKAKALFDD